jgi:hypothetical protein
LSVTTLTRASDINRVVQDKKHQPDGRSPL